MNKKHILGLSVFLALAIAATMWARATERIKNSTPVPDGLYTISYLAIDVNNGHPTAEFGLADAANQHGTNYYAFLIESEFDFKDGRYKRGSQVRVSDNGSKLALVSQPKRIDPPTNLHIR